MRPKRAVELIVLLGIMVWGCHCENKSPAKNNKARQKAKINMPTFDSITTDQVFVYNCDDTLQFTAHVTKDSTWLFLPDTTVKVLRVRSGSGARFESGKYLYWSKGNEAILQKPQRAFMVCQSIPKERSWAAAKLRGIDFRAVGQEPGWFLELTNDGKLKYIGNYGEDTVITDTPKPSVNSQGQPTVYRTEKQGQHIEVAITDTLCTDAMSGVAFPQTVSVTVNGASYRGCGRYLQQN